jgi:hypothetical protein
MSKGVGNSQTYRRINADIHRINKDGAYTSITGALHVVTALSTKFIRGNNALARAEEGAIIDLEAGLNSFKSAPGSVPIISVRPKVMHAPQPFG